MNSKEWVGRISSGLPFSWKLIEKGGNVAGVGMWGVGGEDLIGDFSEKEMKTKWSQESGFKNVRRGLWKIDTPPPKEDGIQIRFWGFFGFFFKKVKDAFQTEDFKEERRVGDQKNPKQ